MRTLLAALLLACSTWAVAAGVSPGEAFWRQDANRFEVVVLAAQPTWAPVSIMIDHSIPDRATVKDKDRGIDFEVDGFGGGSLRLGGTLSGTAYFRQPRRSWEGIDVMARGVNVSASPMGPMRFSVNGLCDKDDGSKGDLVVGVDLDGLPLRDLEIHQPGLDLTARWQAGGYVIEGKADSKVYGNRALSVIAAAISGLTWDLFRL